MHIVFVTQELSPIVAGGAGAVVEQLASALSREHRVTVILAAHGQLQPPDVGYTVVPVELTEPDGTLDWFLDRSRRCADALGRIVADEGPPDLVEFTDFEALGFVSLVDRNRLGLSGCRTAIRFHGTFGAIAEAIGANPYPWPELDVLEREAIAMCDAVLVASPAMAEWVVRRYDIEPERAVVAPPIVPAVPHLGWRPGPKPVIAAFGRLTEQKGVDVLVSAALPLLAGRPDLSLELLGPDGWSAVANRPMSEVLLDMVPRSLHDRIRLVGEVPRDAAMEMLSVASVVVVPSRFETFCLAAHEIRRAGIPLVVAAQPAFAEFGDQDGVVVFDGTVAGLTRTLAALLDDPGWGRRLADRPPPQVEDPIPAYSSQLPPVRHPYAQAARATAAVHRADALAAPQRAVSIKRAAERALRILPKPLARLAVRLIPTRIKDRFRAVASWPAELERREHRRRVAAVESAMADGRYPILERPRVSVVIPCFNHGAFLKEALLSVFEQTFDSWEVVVIDDGSTDPATVTAIDRIDWPRVHVLRQPNTGLPGARNAGIDAARGDFIVPLDADDVLLPRYLERMVAALEGDPAAGYAHCWAEWFGDVNQVWATRPFNSYAMRLSNSVLGGATIRRDALGRVGGYDSTMTSGNEDWDLWLRMLEAGIGNLQVREVLYRYRIRGVSMTVTTLSRFEAGRREIMLRHPRLYGSDELRRAKREHYPAVSVLSPELIGPIPTDADMEVLIGRDFCNLARQAAGKYLLQLPDGGGIDYEGVEELVDWLEGLPSAAAAVSGRLTLLRRWAVLDPETAFDRPPDMLSCPDPGWIVPHRLDVDGRTLEVERQPPEQQARIPSDLLG